jgi:acetyl esterase/lipase
MVTNPQSEPSAIIDLWTNSPTTQPAAGLSITERAKDGSHDRVVAKIKHPTLRVFLPEHPDEHHTACIICPGGGFGYVTMDKEGDHVAAMLNHRGIAAFVLMYRLPDGQPPAAGSDPLPIQDITRAIRLVRAHSSPSAGPAVWDINPDRIGVMGFSAGGQIASTAATHFDDGDADSTDPVNCQSSRPDFAILMYPVISMHDPIAHVPSRNNLLGKTPSTTLLDRFSAERNLTSASPPLFVVHAENDKTVDVRNSIQLAESAARTGVPCTLMLLKTGGHGFGLGVNTESSGWASLCTDWIEQLDLPAKPIERPQ